MAIPPQAARPDGPTVDHYLQVGAAHRDRRGRALDSWVAAVLLVAGESKVSRNTVSTAPPHPSDRSDRRDLNRVISARPLLVSVTATTAALSCRTARVGHPTGAEMPFVLFTRKESAYCALPPVLTFRVDLCFPDRPCV